ncbi:MAG: oligosaccharide flippase family protein [Cyanobacteria bacterium P01_F01_bin.86]
MKSAKAQTNRQILDGTVWVFLAEGLLLPTGLITAGVLTRQLGPAGYGLFTLASVIVAWIEWSITSIFSRTTIKFVGEASDWRPIGALVVQLHLGVSLGVTLLLWILAPTIAVSLNEPSLGNYLRLFALDIPIFSLASAQRQILIGRGQFRERALATAGRWTLRLVLIVVLVELGFSVSGAILGSIGASLVECLITRYFAPVPWFQRSKLPVRSLFGYALPLFGFAMSMRLYDKLDLFLLKLLGGSAEQSGIYGAAQNLAFIPTILSISFSPLLLSSLSRLLAAGELAQAKQLARHALRLVLALLPIGAITAATAPDIIQLIYGEAFLATAPILSLLVFGTLSLMMVSVGTTILTAASKPSWPLIIAAPLLPLAAWGHWWTIPTWQATGAALVTMLVAGLGALLMVFAIYRLWQILPPLATLLRSLLACGALYFLASHWSVGQFWLLPQLLMLALMIPFLFFILGEFNRQEIALAGSVLTSLISSKP